MPGETRRLRRFQRETGQYMQPCQVVKIVQNSSIIFRDCP
jgi:hypothetical protein